LPFWCNDARQTCEFAMCFFRTTNFFPTNSWQLDSNVFVVPFAVHLCFGARQRGVFVVCFYFSARQSSKLVLNI
jgi:hypothetical protein